MKNKKEKPRYWDNDELDDVENASGQEEDQEEEAQKKCPNCSTYNNITASRCENCGQSLLTGWRS